MRLLSRLLPLPAIAIASAFAFTAPASAGILVSSASSCASETLTQPFTPWLDLAHYTPAPGGNFETGATGWTLSGGAAVTSGNESFQVGGAGDSSSLALPDGSSATSPAQCVGIDHPTIRFFARNSGSLLSTLSVSVQWEDAFGNVNTTPIGIVTAGGSWQPTLPLAIAVNLLPLLPGDQTAVAFKFAPLGGGGNWQIDDVYVDPYGRT